MTAYLRDSDESYGPLWKRTVRVVLNCVFTTRIDLSAPDACLPGLAVVWDIFYI